MFEWDASKARANLRKHTVSFDDAATVLSDRQGDRYHVEEYDDAHSMEEDRWITTASHPFDRAMRVLLRLLTRPGILLSTPHEPFDPSVSSELVQRDAPRFRVPSQNR